VGFLGRELLAALGTPASEDGAPSTGPHAKPEAVRLRTLAVIWLECALHGNDSLRPVKVEGRQRSGAEMAPKHRWYGPAKAGVNAAASTIRCRDTPSVHRGPRPRGGEPTGSRGPTAPGCGWGPCRPTTRMLPEPPPGRSPPWGQRWGRAVDERGTTSAGAIGRRDLGTIRATVPSRILTAIRRVSRTDRCSSTCPQGLWLFRVSLFLHPFKPMGWGQGSSMGCLPQAQR